MAQFIDHLNSVPYVTPAEVLACCPAAVNAGMTTSDIRLIEAIADASLILYYLTGRQFAGTSEAAFRPCSPCNCGNDGQSCGCARNLISMGNLWPVTAVKEVWIDGIEVGGGLFHIDEWMYLVRNDGGQWPTCQSLTAPPPYCTTCFEVVEGAPVLLPDVCNQCHAFEVIVEHGMPIPSLLKRAARELACHLINVSCFGAECKLPERVSSISRRGVSIDVGDPLDYLDKGKTGIYAVDLAIVTLNPQKLQSPSFFWDPNHESNKLHRTYT